MFKNFADKVRYNFDTAELAMIGIVIAIIAVVTVLCFHSKPLTCDKGQTVHSHTVLIPHTTIVGKTSITTLQPVVTEYCA